VVFPNIVETIILNRSGFPPPQGPAPGTFNPIPPF
jgi:hypothetical protein